MGDKIRIDNYGGEYEPSDSENGYSEDEKEILEEVRKGRRRNQESKQEVMAFADSNDDAEEDDEDVGEFMEDSDIEGHGADNDDDGIPDSRDWGNKSRNYYNTDFVDPDFETYNEQEEEMAKQEEEEAKLIQIRLAKQMREEDFLLNELALPSTPHVESEKAEESTKMKADFARLSKRERQQLFQKDSPEFSGLVADFEVFLRETETLLAPIMQYVVEHEVPMIPALEFAQLYQNVVLTYCSNVAFYLLLKSNRVSIKNHPIAKRLVQLKKLLTELKDKYENIIRPQLEALLERIADGDEFQVLEIKPTSRATNRKARLIELDGEPSENRSKLQEYEQDVSDGESDDDEGENGEDANARRSITYQMAKNKGLTPHRKKELRNPRVKHRSKFRKALIRRKGAVRTVRKETKRYGGEISGIKATVSKSIKFKV